MKRCSSFITNMLELKNFVLLIYLFIIFTISKETLNIDIIVQTSVGPIKGVKATDGNYSMFLGIPYAQVNKSNPFGLSIAHPKFDDVFVADDDSAICPQIEEFNNTIVGKIDCLHLNVYAPISPNYKRRLPVLVWIYGGGFKIGFAGRYLYGPRYLVRHDIIFVTFNYRIGPYGFMCLDTPDVPGNQGLKDQLLALRWIKNNIESFGGDSQSITLIGHSAGAQSVDFHLRFTNENLFNKAGIQSASTFTPQLFSYSDRTFPLKIAKGLGFNTSDFEKSLSFLAKLDPKLIISTASKITNDYRICIEKDFTSIEKFIWDHPINVKVTNKMPMLIGITDNESLGKYGNKDLDYFIDLQDIKDYLKGYFDFEEIDLSEMEQLVREFYLGDLEINEKFKSNYIDFSSDTLFVNPVTRILESLIEDEFDEIYHYTFSYNGRRNFSKHRLNLTQHGASHADEIGYLFDVSYMKNITPEDQLIIDRMTTMWANFVKYGDPIPETNELLPIKWEPTRKGKMNYLDINSNLKLGSRPFNKRNAFWKLFFIHNGHLQRTYND